MRDALVSITALGVADLNQSIQVQLNGQSCTTKYFSALWTIVARGIGVQSQHVQQEFVSISSTAKNLVRSSKCWTACSRCSP